jgi:PAS domain-containing protein
MAQIGNVLRRKVAFNVVKRSSVASYSSSNDLWTASGITMTSKVSLEEKSSEVFMNHAKLHSEQISFATPFADAVAPLPVEMEEAEATARQVNINISYATPFSDAVGPRYSEDIKPIPSSAKLSGENLTNLSFASPESDFCAPLPVSAEEEGQYAARLAEIWANFSFASPESDFTAPSTIEIEESIATARDIANHYSFSSPESDFTQPLLVKTHAELPKTRAAAEESSEQARVITSSIPPFQIEAVNDAWVKLCGFSPDETRSQTLELLQGPMTPLHITQRIADATKAGLAQEATLTNYRKDGTSFKNRLRIQPLDDGSMLGVLEETSHEAQDGHKVMGYM